MTTKEIATAVGKKDGTVRLWVRSVASKNDVIASKNNASTSTHPADYTLDETIEIIREGMGDSAAGIFQANAEKKGSRLDKGFLQQIRLSVRDGLLTREEARHILQVEKITVPVPIVQNLGIISKPAYAVEMKEREKAKQKLIESNIQSNLFE